MSVALLAMFPLHNPPHPGEFIRDTYIEPFARELAGYAAQLRSMDRKNTADLSAVQKVEFIFVWSSLLTLATFGLLRPIRLFELVDETMYRCTLVNSLSSHWNLRYIELVHR